jgi:hypothetical protein
MKKLILCLAIAMLSVSSLFAQNSVKIGVVQNGKANFVFQKDLVKSSFLQKWTNYSSVQSVELYNVLDMNQNETGTYQLAIKGKKENEIITEYFGLELKKSSSGVSGLFLTNTASRNSCTVISCDNCKLVSGDGKGGDLGCWCFEKQDDEVSCNHSILTTSDAGKLIEAIYTLAPKNKVKATDK